MIASFFNARKITATLLLVAASFSLVGCAQQRHTAYKLPNYQASVDVRAPLDGSEKPEIVARLTLGPNGN